MKKYFISFGTTHNYKNSLERIKKNATDMNFFDKIYIYTEKDFDEVYLQKNLNFMQNNKGYGFWKWKSYFVKKTFNEMEDGSILIYADAGCYLVANELAIQRLNEYVDLCNNSPYGNLAFQMCFPEKSYTKSDVFVHLNETNTKMKNSGQLVGGIFVLKKCDFTVKLIDEYHRLCDFTHLIDDSPSVAPPDKDFVSHRHDQSIFSILRKKMGCVMIPDETWFTDFMSEEAMSKPILATRIRY